MRLEYQILAAVGVDLMLGDPAWLPHPVRGIGRLAAALEPLARRTIRNQRAAGVAAAMAVYTVVALAAWALLRLSGMIHPALADAVAIGLIYSAIAARDLARHSTAVWRALTAADLPEARRAVGRIVGRDTECLDEAGVVRAAVESVAESTVDGVTAPLFYAVIAGPLGAIVYRAINTLDSLFGHKDSRYRRFGWAAAKIDDVANYLPARLTAPLLCVAGLLLGQRALGAWRMLRRDRRNHESPNAGLAEAAMAGALGVQIGGVNYYAGEPLEKPPIGDPLVPLSPRHIPAANALMFVTAGLFLAVCLLVRVGYCGWHVPEERRAWLGTLPRPSCLRDVPPRDQEVQP